jgi:hypothetical protein
MQEWQYPGRVTWQKKHVKKKIRLFCIHERTERTRYDVGRENFYHECIYDILLGSRHPKHKTPTLNHLKANIARIHNTRFQSLHLHTQAATLFQGEQPPIFHLSNMRKWRVSRLITSIIDTDGVKQTSTRGILRTFVSLLQSKYDTIHVGDRSGGEIAQTAQDTSTWMQRLPRHVHHGGEITCSTAKRSL